MRQPVRRSLRQRRFCCLAGTLLAAVVSLSAPARGTGPDPVSAGLEAFEAGNYDKARTLWLPAAESGNADAQFHLGALFDRALGGGTADHGLAFKWYERAALQGHPEAGYNLGNAYKHGRGTLQSDSLANYWWQRASDAGVAAASFNLAIQYHRGLGTARDLSRATRLFNLAAAAGHVRARELIATGKIESVPVHEEAEAAPPGDSSDGSDAVAWFRNQPAHNYTIQIAAFRSPDGIAAYLRRYGLEESARTVILSRDGASRHHVLVGSFDSRETAGIALQQLPGEVRDAGAWVRPFGELQPSLAPQGAGGQSVSVPD